MRPFVLRTYADFSQALLHAHEASLSSYLLGQKTERLLEQAAANGTKLKVYLADEPYQDAAQALHDRNAAQVARLKQCGIDARLVRDARLHMKAAVVDKALFFDDRNWVGDADLVMEDDAVEDIGTMLRLQREYGTAPALPQSAPSGLALSKQEALRFEAALLSSSTGEIDIATESFGPSDISHTLAQLAQSGQSVHMLVNAAAVRHHERAEHELARLVAAGVQVRVSSADVKMAVTSRGCWLGSANASGDAALSDWGACLYAPATVRTLRSRFAHFWDHAKRVTDLHLAA